MANEAPTFISIPMDTIPGDNFSSWSRQVSTMFVSLATKWSCASGSFNLRQSWVWFAVVGCLIRTAYAEDENDSKIAHAVLGSVAWAFVFPIGAVVMRLARSTKAWFLHAVIQTLGLTMVIAGAGNGIYVALDTAQLDNYHPIIGLILLSWIFFQATGGLLAHLKFAKNRKRNVFGHAHTWLGRAIITLGMLNGGFGLLLSSDGGKGAYISYGVISGVIWVSFVGNAVWFEIVGKATTPAKRADTGTTGNKQLPGNKQLLGGRVAEHGDETELTEH